MVISIFVPTAALTLRLMKIWISVTKTVKCTNRKKKH
jgi:hypothetical protein